MLNLKITNKYSYNQCFKVLIKLNLTLTQYVKLVSNKGINGVLFNIKTRSRNKTLVPST